MPKGYSLRPSARAVTPLELADFTSGMPDDPSDLPNGPLWKRNIEHYTTEKFLRWASQWEPATKLPAPYKYSNAGIGLLSYLLDSATGKRWEDQLNAEIVGPLGLQDTTLRPTPEQRKRLAQGHHPNGSDAPPWPIFAWYAAGGLRSTARDMLRFGEANLGHKEVNGRSVSDELVAAMKLAQTPIYTLPNGRNKQAMAWVNNIAGPGTHPVILKNGGTVGFGTVIVVNPAKDLTLFIAVNQNGSNPAGIGVEMARHLP
jgi:CubicO group peptidase (beta-lactamase class C family)